MGRPKSAPVSNTAELNIAMIVLLDRAGGTATVTRTEYLEALSRAGYVMGEVGALTYQYNGDELVVTFAPRNDRRRKR